MTEQELREEQAEVLLIVGRAAKCLAKRLPADCEVHEYLDEWIAETGAWAGRLLREAPPLRAVQ